ncbi:hypothetical protein [Persicitalea jodogahamensis]|uniref:Uncharacterized protein n=1 Tax=Persicitalea jodogahamensis TaxID=402147 RepID=A0A8J3G8E7_9BACT|nr:hypothetical protein [Persicitalea jodogahamensis]GHB54660.1 hypothetical protein GCM10007390_04680 [Persicitalea jodogahamensis]
MKQFDSQLDVLPYFSALPYDALMEARNVNHVHVPDQRGIYFWFLREEGFEKLSRKLQVVLRPPRHTLKVGDASLVYYGHLGAYSDAKSVQRADNLKYYFQSEIPHNPLEYSLECYSYLSCFRKTISGLLTDDILAEQETVKSFFQNYVLIYFLAYDAITEEEEVVARDAVKSDFRYVSLAIASLSHHRTAGAAYAAKGALVYDNYGPEVRIILERRRYFAELMTLATIRQKHQLDDEAGSELIEPIVYYE